MYEIYTSITICVLIGSGIDFLDADSLSLNQAIGILILSLAGGLLIGVIARHINNI